MSFYDNFVFEITPLKCSVVDVNISSATHCIPLPKKRKLEKRENKNIVQF